MKKSEDTMRLFAAIDIEEGVRQRIAAVQRQLQEELNLSHGQVKWVDPSQIHLTLKFLGEVADDQVVRVCDTLRRTAGQFAAFDFEVRGVGVFGKPARIVWAGTGECPALFQLQAEMEDQFEKLGWEKENRPFAGHLTVCRVKNISAGDRLAKAAAAYENHVFGTVSAGEVILYQSVLGSREPVYTPVSRASLK
ncbi:MAG: RNA 2',3'-cyclic phosphodiesterase [Planctomycetaceae bacterium]|nr:RNA 2',3'-cyclic phosphodiesterase [Planctomycetaceae bacterium]